MIKKIFAAFLMIGLISLAVFIFSHAITKVGDLTNFCQDDHYDSWEWVGSFKIPPECSEYKNKEMFNCALENSEYSEYQSKCAWGGEAYRNLIMLVGSSIFLIMVAVVLLMSFLKDTQNETSHNLNKTSEVKNG